MDGKIFEKLIEVSECAFFISKPEIGRAHV